jgi:hypothetical protein
MKKILVEGFDYRDLVDQVDPVIEVDEYAAKMGDDDEVVTLSFIVKGREAGEDLVDWFERGYDYVLDSQVSDGELTPGKYLVFVELNRRTNVPERIVEMILDMETLTDLPLKDWAIKINDESYDADINELKAAMILSPHEYRLKNESKINEMRNLSGIQSKKIFKQPSDSLLKDYLAKAGL